MNKPKHQKWPDGTRVRFSDEARKAMQKRPGITKPLAAPGNGPDVVYTIDNSDDAHHDVVLRETGERYGTYWLTTVDFDPTPDIEQWTDTAARARERGRPIYVIADRTHQQDIDGRPFVEDEIDPDLGFFTHEAAAQTRVNDLNTPAIAAHADATARYDKQLKAWERKQARAAKLGFSSPDWRPQPPTEPRLSVVVEIRPATGGALA